jgi:uncharacterized protein (DUF2345 family)
MAETKKHPTDEAPLAVALEEDATMPNVRTTEEEVLIDAERKLTLRCGKSSITLYPNGKIVLRGDYIFSDAEGVNRIAGGRIELN